MMNDKMQPGDYIRASRITNEDEMQHIREAVQGMGYLVSSGFGRYLVLHRYGFLYWTDFYPSGREWTPGQVLAWQPATTSLDWSGHRIPGWVKFITMDKSGEALGHERRPSKRIETWGSSGRLASLPHLDGYARDWEESLVARPAVGATDCRPSTPGDCDTCGEHSTRLTDGMCAPCRDRLAVRP